MFAKLLMLDTNFLYLITSIKLEPIEKHRVASVSTLKLKNPVSHEHLSTSTDFTQYPDEITAITNSRDDYYSNLVDKITDMEECGVAKELSAKCSTKCLNHKKSAKIERKIDPNRSGRHKGISVRRKNNKEGGNRTLYKKDNILMNIKNGKCSEKYLRYRGCILSILMSLETYGDLDGALRPSERALDIFKWFKRKGCDEVNVIHYPRSR